MKFNSSFQIQGQKEGEEVKSFVYEIFFYFSVESHAFQKLFVVV